MRKLLAAAAGLLLGAHALPAHAAPTVAIRVPERFRLLTDQRFDLRVEATGVTPDLAATARIFINGTDVTDSLPAPEITNNNDTATAVPDRAFTYRLVSFPTTGVRSVVAVVTDVSGPGTSPARRIGVQAFGFTRANGQPLPKKNIILFSGDAMGTAYRDIGRLVSRSTANRFREGFFDELQAMDTMPTSGMVLTHALDRVVPDSANTASAWAMGNKTIDGALGAFPDNTDARFDSNDIQGTKQFALDNPRVENLWEYLRRIHGYRTGIVTTADVADASPAAEGAHTFTRDLLYDIARQFRDGGMTPNLGPTFDVIMGGGREKFNARTAANSGDTRNFVTEFAGLGYAIVNTRTELNALPAGAAAPPRVLGLFRTGNMNVAYDKLGLVRPADEIVLAQGIAGPVSDFPDQPFLDEMTSRAVASLSVGNAPFILFVEGASIDKESHVNNAVGMMYEVIELDKAVAVGRSFGTRNGTVTNTNTLVLVTADHNQTLSIIGVSDTTSPGATQNTRSQTPYPNQPGPGAINNADEVTGFPDYADANGDGFPENTNRFRMDVGFRTTNHDGACVPITADGPGSLLFRGYFDQTDIFFKMARVLSSDTSPIDELEKVLQKNFRIVGPNY